MLCYFAGIVIVRLTHLWEKGRIRIREAQNMPIPNASYISVSAALSLQNKVTTFVPRTWVPYMQMPRVPACRGPLSCGWRRVVGAAHHPLCQPQARPRAARLRRAPLCGATHCGHRSPEPAAGPGTLSCLLQVQEVLLLHLLRARRLARYRIRSFFHGRVRP